MQDITPAPLAETFGLLLRSPDPVRALDTLADEAVIEAYVRTGAVLFRGFRTTLETFDRFTSRFLQACVVNGNETRRDVVPARQIQTVNAGCEPIALHAEMGYSPIRPDLLFFHCLTPPQRGSGETLLCDGVDAWNRMAPHLRTPFEQSPIRYHFARSHLLGAQLQSHEARLAADPGVRHYERHADGSVDLDFVVPAARPSLHGAGLAFANSVIVEAASASFDSGVPIARELRLELFAFTTKMSHRLHWEEGDILMLDNSRIMHGRNRIQPGDTRSIVVRMGWGRTPSPAPARATSPVPISLEEAR